MPVFSHAHTDDPLGLATAGDIVLVSVSPERQFEVVDMLSELAVPLKSSAVKIRGVIATTIDYELKAASLVIPLGTDIGTDDYRIASISANCNANGYPTVSVVAIRPEAGSFAATPGSYGNLTVVGGFGVVNLWGSTCTQPISSTLSISSQRAIANHHTTGVILTLGMVMYAYRKDVTIEGYTDITIPVGAILSSDNNADPKTSREAYNTFRVSYTDYLIA